MPPTWSDRENISLFSNQKKKPGNSVFVSKVYDLQTESPLRIGAGTSDFFRDRLRDVGLYHRSLSETEIHALARP